ncbi:histone-lysine N-methyltransferase SETMAR [Trichonephila clavipes]|nr:histone-lysine N-methyltransferase SETMAR [Trichonephila clavipes]
MPPDRKCQTEDHEIHRNKGLVFTSVVCHIFELHAGGRNTPTQIKDELDSVYGDSVPSFTTVKIWTAKFKRVRKSLGDDERSGRSNTATTDENITKVQQMVLRQIVMSKKRTTAAKVTTELNQHLESPKPMIAVRKHLHKRNIYDRVEIPNPLVTDVYAKLRLQ